MNPPDIILREPDPKTIPGLRYRYGKKKAYYIRVKVVVNTGETVIEYKNIEFGDIPDSTFELPAGVLITNMPTS